MYQQHYTAATMMPKLTYESLMNRKGLIPLFATIVMGTGLAGCYLIRQAVRNPDVW